MATFFLYPIEEGTPGQTVWKKIRDFLVTHKSVEVVVVEKGEAELFELHAWKGIRQDDSNSPNARPDVNY